MRNKWQKEARSKGLRAVDVTLDLLGQMAPPICGGMLEDDVGFYAAYAEDQLTFVLMHDDHPANESPVAFNTLDVELPRPMRGGGSSKVRLVVCSFTRELLNEAEKLARAEVERVTMGT